MIEADDVFVFRWEKQCHRTRALLTRSLDVDYMLVIFGDVIGYSGDDINKFLWMVRIAEGKHPKDIRVTNPISTFVFYDANV